jgi:hypothetical protein
VTTDTTSGDTGATNVAVTTTDVPSAGRIVTVGVIIGGFNPGPPGSCGGSMAGRDAGAVDGVDAGAGSAAGRLVRGVQLTELEFADRVVVESATATNEYERPTMSPLTVHGEPVHVLVEVVDVVVSVVVMTYPSRVLPFMSPGVIARVTAPSDPASVTAVIVGGSGVPAVGVPVTGALTGPTTVAVRGRIVNEY